VLSVTRRSPSGRILSRVDGEAATTAAAAPSPASADPLPPAAPPAAPPALAPAAALPRDDPAPPRATQPAAAAVPSWALAGRLGGDGRHGVIASVDDLFASDDDDDAPSPPPQQPPPHPVAPAAAPASTRSPMSPRCYLPPAPAAPPAAAMPPAAAADASPASSPIVRGRRHSMGARVPSGAAAAASVSPAALGGCRSSSLVSGGVVTMGEAPASLRQRADARRHDGGTTPRRGDGDDDDDDDDGGGGGGGGGDHLDDVPGGAADILARAHAAVGSRLDALSRAVQAEEEEDADVDEDDEAPQRAWPPPPAAPPRVDALDDTWLAGLSRRGAPDTAALADWQLEEQLTALVLGLMVSPPTSTTKPVQVRASRSGAGAAGSRRPPATRAGRGR